MISEDLDEVMEMSDGLRELVLVGASSVELRKKAVEEGMLTLRMSGLEKIKQGRKSTTVAVDRLVTMVSVRTPRRTRIPAAKTTTKTLRIASQAPPNATRNSVIAII